jgi:hypothetical protein
LASAIVRIVLDAGNNLNMISGQMELSFVLHMHAKQMKLNYNCDVLKKLN